MATISDANLLRVTAPCVVALSFDSPQVVFAPCRKFCISSISSTDPYAIEKVLQERKGVGGEASSVKLNLTDPCRIVPCQYHG